MPRSCNRMLQRINTHVNAHAGNAKRPRRKRNQRPIRIDAVFIPALGMGEANNGEIGRHGDNVTRAPAPNSVRRRINIMQNSHDETSFSHISE